MLTGLIGAGAACEHRIPAGAAAGHAAVHHSADERGDGSWHQLHQPRLHRCLGPGQRPPHHAISIIVIAPLSLVRELREVLHYEICKYYQSTSKARLKVLQSLIV